MLIKLIWSNSHLINNIALFYFVCNSHSKGMQAFDSYWVPQQNISPRKTVFELEITVKICCSTLSQFLLSFDKQKRKIKH